MNEPTTARQYRSIDTLALPGDLRGPREFVAATAPAQSDTASRSAIRPGPPPLKRSAGTPAPPLTISPAMATGADSRSTSPTVVYGDGFDDDIPFRAPAIWQSDTPEAADRGGWQWTERTTAAFLGFAGGILIVVPAVFFLTTPKDHVATLSTGDNVDKIEIFGSSTPVPGGTTTKPDTAQASASPTVDAAGIIGAWLDTGKTPPASSATGLVKTSEQQPAGARSDAATLPAANRAETGEMGKQSPAQADIAAGVANPSKVIEARARVAAATDRIDEARALLRTHASADMPILWFRLAETYDPLIAQAPGVARQREGADITPTDIQFARFYYQRALTHGIEEARERLAALSQ